MQAALLERDVLLPRLQVAANYYHSVQAFLHELLGKSSPEVPWVLEVSPVIALMQDQAKMLPCVADVVLVVLLTEEAGDNDNWTRHYSILDVIHSVVALRLHVRTRGSYI